MTTPKYHGIIPPLVTPLLKHDCLDIEGLSKLIEHVISGGVHGIFILGSCGEGPSLSFKLKSEMIKMTCQLVNHRVPVLVGITDSSFKESINLSKIAAEHKADALVLAPPFYFPSSQKEFLEYLENIIPELPLPLFIYNMPKMTKVSLEPTTIEMASHFDNVIGVKDSSVDMLYFHKLKYALRNKKDFPILIGPEEFLAESLLFGAHGGVSGGANLFPQLYVNLYHATQEHDLLKVKKYHDIIIQVSQTIYTLGQYDSSLIKGLKTSLSLFNICSDVVEEPFQKFCSEKRTILQQNLSSIKLLLET